MNDFRQMNANIALGEWNAIDLNLRLWKNKFLQYSHIQTLPCTKGAPWWRYITQLYVNIAIHFYLRSLCEYFIIAIVQVYLCNKGIELLIILIVTLNFHQWGYCSFCYDHMQCFFHANEGIIHLVLWLM
jgi:hypothetical protein